MDCQYVLKSSQPKVPLCFCYPNPPFSAVLEGVAFPLNCWNLHKIAGLCCKRSFFRRATCNAWETGNLTNRFEGQRIRDQSNTSNSLDKSWSIAKHTRLTSAVRLHDSIVQDTIYIHILHTIFIDTLCVYFQKSRWFQFLHQSFPVILPQAVTKLFMANVRIQVAVYKHLTRT